MKSNNYQQKQQGFTLIELLITIVILAVLASVAILYGPAIIKGSKDKLSKNRLAAVSDAQNRFKSGMGKGRFATICELSRTPTEDGSVLLPVSVAKFNENCEPIGIDGWFVFDDFGAADPTEIPALRKTYLIHLMRDDSKTERYCMGPDGILRHIIVRRGAPGCTMNSPEAKQ